MTRHSDGSRYGAHDIDDEAAFDTGRLKCRRFILLLMTAKAAAASIAQGFPRYY